MPNPSIEKVVDDLIASGRVQRELRGEYIAQLESGLKDDLLRGADYTNKTKQLADEKRRLEEQVKADYNKLQEEKRSLEKWQNQVQGELSKLDQLPEITATLAAYEQTLRDYNILDRVVVPTTPTAPKPTPTPTQQQQAPTNHAFLTKQDAGNALRDFAQLYSKADMIRAKHLKLFGEYLEDDLVGHYLETGEDLEQHWRVKYAVNNREQEIAIKNKEAERAAIREEERSKLLQEIALNPGKVVAGPHSFSDRGVSPLLEKFGHSRALQHSQTHANDNAAKGMDAPVAVPEKRPELAAQMERVSKASEFYTKHFDVSGNPVTAEGEKMFRKHFVTD